MTVLIVIFFSQIADAQSHDSRIHTVSRAWLYSGASLDLGTTLHGFHSGRQEKNPLIKNIPGNRYVMTSAAVMGSSVIADLTTNYLRSRGHRRLALLTNFSLGSLHAGAGFHNMRR